MEFNFFKRNKNQKVETRSAAEDIAEYSPYDCGSFLFGTRMLNRTSLNLSSVYSAVSIISNSIAELPINVRDCSTEEKAILPNHPIALAFKRSLIGKFTMMKQVMHDLMLYGNAYVYIIRKGDEIIGLRYLSRGSVSIVYNEKKQELYYLAPYVSTDKINPFDMLHFTMNGEDGVNGKGIISYAERSIKTSDYTEQKAEDFFSRGCNIGGVLKVNGVVNEQQKKDAKKNWEQTYGRDGSGGVAVLGADMDYQPVTANAQESQMTETRQWNLTDIARFFNISPVMLGDLTHSSYSTIEASNIQYLTTTLQPYISLIECELNRKLCVDMYDDVCIDLDESYILRADKQSTVNYYSTLVDKGIITINEARKALGYSPMANCDDLHVAYSDPQQNAINSLDDDKKEDIEE